MTKTKTKRKSSKRAWIFLVMLVGIALGVAWAVNQYWSETAKVVDQSAKSTKSIDDNVQFAKLLKEGSVARLKRHAEARQKLENEIVVLELDNISKQIRLAERIVAMSNSAEDRVYARTLKLASLIERENLSLKFEMQDSDSTAELFDYAVECLLVDRDQFGEMANDAKCLVKVSQFIAERNVDNRAQIRNQALELFATNPERVNDFEHARLLSKMLESVQKNGVSTEAVPFVKKFVDQFSKSEDRKILEFVDTFKIGVDRASFEIPNVLEADPTQRLEKLQQLLVRAEAIGNSGTDEKTLVKLLDSVRDLIRLGFVAEAKVVREKIGRYAERSTEIADKLQKIDAGFALTDRSFDERGLLNKRGRQINFYSNPSEFRILLFLSKNSIKQANQIYRELSVGLDDESRNITKILLVFVDDGTANEKKNTMIRIAAKEKVGILILDLNSPTGQAFAKRFPTEATPVSVLLRNDTKILAIDPPGKAVSEIIQRNRNGA